MKRYFSISALLASAIVLAAGCSLTGDFDESVREEITEPVGELTIEVDFRRRGLSVQNHREAGRNPCHGRSYPL